MRQRRRQLVERRPGTGRHHGWFRGTGRHRPLVPRPRPTPRPTSAARRRPTAPPPPTPAATPRPASAMPPSAWPTTSPVAATSRSTTPRARRSRRRQTDLGITFEESTPTGEGDRAERLQGLVDAGAGLVQGNGFLFNDSTHDRRRRQPRRQLHDRRRRRRRAQRGVARVRRGAGLVPRRRCRRPQEPDRHDRVHRRRRERPDQEVRGRLRRRRPGREPGHRDPESTTSPSRRTSPASTTRPRARRSPPRSTRAAPT